SSATDAFGIERGEAPLRAHRHAAGVAKHMGALDQPMPDGGALVEDEAFALPQALLFGHGLQVLQDAALQVIHLVHPFGLEERGRLRPADAAVRERADLRRRARPEYPFALGAEQGGETAEACRLRTDRAGESARRHFVVVRVSITIVAGSAISE